MNQRCCAKCKTPYNCGNPACACHAAGFFEQAVWAQVLAENAPERTDARYHMDDYRGHRNPNGDDMATGGTLDPRR